MITPKRSRLWLATLSALFVVAGCSNDDISTNPTPGIDDYVKVVSKATLKAGDKIPAPTSPVVLTVDGAIDNPNVGKTAQFDMQTLKALGVVEYKARDSSSGSDAEIMFSGVLLSDVLATVGVSSGATKVHSVALNDYAVDIPMSDPKKMPVLLAVEADGKTMSVEEFGPIRVVYPNLNVDLLAETNDAFWIWQLATLTVE